MYIYIYIYIYICIYILKETCIICNGVLYLFTILKFIKTGEKFEYWDP